jgi:predicted dehydrogenase
MPDLRLALIGCGAVAASGHLPALQRIGVTPSLLIDRDASRAARLAGEFGVRDTGCDYRAHLGRFDAAVVALPHHLHERVCVDLLRRGVHVLVEKPMATSAASCSRMIAAADEGGATLAIGLMRRFRHAAHWVKEALEARLLGEILSFDIEEGTPYCWPVTSDFFLRRETAGGGVLIDTGPHTLDLALWWLGDLHVREYQDDSYGGVEADCLVRLESDTGARGRVELSRTRNLRNTAILRGTRGELEVSLHSNSIRAFPAVLLRHRAGRLRGSRLAPQHDLELFVAEHRDWLGAIRSGRSPIVSGTEASRSVALIEECYRRQTLWSLPWMETAGQPSNAVEAIAG